MTLATPISPSEFLSAAPKSVNGNTPYAARYASDLRRAWLEHAARDARTLQSHLGPSELGVECDRQVAGKLAALPETNHVVDPWPSIRGRALHTHAEGVFQADNHRTGVLRWLTERKVTPRAMWHAVGAAARALLGFQSHPGTADLYDAVEQAVVDHKFLGESSMAKIRKEPPRKYRVQLFLYGLGYAALGLPVRRVMVAAYPATAGSLDGLYVWEHRFTDENGEVAPEVRELLEVVAVDTERRKEQAEAILAQRLAFTDVPASADSDECYFCPFYRPQAAKDSGPGCPGSAAATG